MTTYLLAEFKSRTHNLKYWAMKRTMYEKGAPRTTHIQYLGKNERVIRWIKEQTYLGWIHWAEAEGMIRKIEDDKFASYFFLGPKWADLKALGYDPKKRSYRSRFKEKKVEA